MKISTIALLAVFPFSAWADSSVIERVDAGNNGTGWSFAVTLRHPDSGWDHYADGWEVPSPDGNRLGYRELLHPHETEQPFTRSLGGVVVPDGIDHVLIRTRCSVDGWDVDTVTVPLDR